jgi:hypothetical protein
MANIEIAKGRVVQGIYADAVFQNAWSKYSFSFKIDGAAGHVRCLPERGGYCANYPAKGGELFLLAQEVERLIRQSKSGLDTLDIRNFLCKHLRAMSKVEQELQHIPASKDRYELLNWNPLDKMCESFSAP